MISSTKLQHLKAYLGNARARSIRDNVPFNLTLNDLVDIATDVCPIFNTPFVWGASGLGKGKTRLDTPQLDKIHPEIGYVVGNIAFISSKANKMKDNGTMQDHYDIADWIWNHTHAKKNTTTPVPTRPNQQGDIRTKHGAPTSTGFGENDNHLDNHSGTIRGEDTNHSAQASSRDGMGCRGEKMATLVALERIESNGEPDTETVRLEYKGRYILD